MTEDANREAVDRLFAGLNAGNVAVMNEVFSDDSVMYFPQSGEIIRGRANRQAVYEATANLPSIAPYRILATGALVVAEAILDYGDDPYRTVFIFEFRDGRIARQTSYWAKPFPAPDWRAPWVEKAAPGPD